MSSNEWSQGVERGVERQTDNIKGPPDGIVECQGVWRSYEEPSGEVHALEGIDLNVSKGEFLALCGPSGSGKTTLLNLIGALDTPTRGSITLDGIGLSTLDASERASLRLKKIGFIFQAYNLIPVLSSLENVELIMQLQGISAETRSQRAKEVLARVGLSGMFHRRPSELSGGQQQRVAVARAIASRPSLILADEPTANLDSKTAESLIDLMREMHGEEGITFIFSTHDPRVMNRAERLVQLKDGKIAP